MYTNIEKTYEHVKEVYAGIGIDTDAVIQRIDKIPISIHCWQGDDLIGFEDRSQGLTGGIQATGNYPGGARTIDELRMDMEQAFSHIPGEKKISLHAIYLDTKEKIPRDEIEPEHFSSWVSWARETGIGLDFNPTCFSHKLADDGLTLSHPDESVRSFWIRHVQKCRNISEYFGRELGQASVMNIWIPDGFKDVPADRLSPKIRLQESLDQCLAEKKDKRYNIDILEGKLFGLGLESYVVGSHEFYAGYGVKNNVGVCFDTGHFHPTEAVSEKLSSASLFFPEILLHLSRPVRWDSDHVVTLNEELIAIAQEVLRHKLENKVYVGLDYFDASINRVAAWVIGTCNVRKALLIAGLEPFPLLASAEQDFDFTRRLAYHEEFKSFPWQIVWAYYCEQKGVLCGLEWIKAIQSYENNVLKKRS